MYMYVYIYSTDNYTDDNKFNLYLDIYSANR